MFISRHLDVCEAYVIYPSILAARNQEFVTCHTACL